MGYPKYKLPYDDGVSNELHNLICVKVHECLDKFEDIWGGQCPEPPLIKCDLKGRTAGQCRVRANVIRLNTYLLNTYREEFINQTVVHEMAHIFVHILYDRSRKEGHNVRYPRNHGNTWKSVMRFLGVQPNRCHTYVTKPARKVKRFKYECGCPKDNVVKFTSIRHNRQQSGKANYCCTRCNGRFRYIGPA